MSYSRLNKTIRTSLEDGEKYFDHCIDCRKQYPLEFSLDQICNKTICGNTMVIMDLYNLEKNYHGTIFRKGSDDDYREYTETWLKKAIRLLKPSASLYVCCDWESSLIIGDVLKKLAVVRNRITWQREKGRGAKTNWKNSMEDIWFATIGNTYTFNLDAVRIRKKVIAPYRIDGKPKDWVETPSGNYRDTCPGNFWNDISIPYWSMAENTEHPTQKPEKLIAKLLLASSNSGDIVFDPFLGSGTTSVTAKKLGRQYVGIEQNPQYCTWAEQRLAMADTDASIQGYADGVFFERNSGKL